MSDQAPSQSKPKSKKNLFKQTLNLPKTSFAMKASLVQNEPATLERWESTGLYRRVQESRPTADPFVFHDGPPYANGDIHLGHMLNKVLKDLVVRSKLMQGWRCPFVPGWDCHGLPIEHKVMQELQSKGKLEKLAELEPSVRAMAIRKACRAYAEKFVKLQSGQMRRLLTLADYDDPYLTMHESYEGAVLEVFAEMVERGVVYRQLKPVHWSIDNRTALAEAELEYAERRDPSIYVDFEAADGDAVYEAFGLDDAAREEQNLGQTPSFMIWTTTPWTLPANLAIAVHAASEYALVRIDGNVTVLAAKLVPKVAEIAKAEKVEVLASTSGESLVGLRYRHPFLEAGPDFEMLTLEAIRGAKEDAIFTVVEAPYVTLEDGTGLVHTAPGHGAEDYQTGLKMGLPIYCPVDAGGAYDGTAPEWLRGRRVWDANPVIIERLVESGHMFHHFEFDHSYPHDWRSKTPTIYRATEQWFVGVDAKVKGRGKSLRELALGETESDVKFVPAWGKNRLRGMLESRPDWCISRQRAWGLPIPAFYLPDGTTVLTPASVRAVAQRFRAVGSDAWFNESPAELLQHWSPADDSDWDGANDLDLSTLTKSTDIFDVWFESGSSWNAVMRERTGGAHKPFDASYDEQVAYPIDLYLEGSDQHRGWFQLSLLPALAATGRPPFKTLLTHGFMVDQDGRKMSKSIGNTLDVKHLIETYGADVCRWFLASISYEADIKAGDDLFKVAGEAYRKVRNTVRFLLSVLDDFDPLAYSTDSSTVDPTSIDAWALAETDRVRERVINGYNAYQFNAATNAIYNFCNDTLSSVYLAAVKDRLYCDAADSPRRRRTQASIHRIADTLCRLLAPILPHTADEAWRELHRIPKDDPRSVHEHEFDTPVAAEASDDWAKVLAVRERGLKALENTRGTTDLDNPLDTAVTLPDPDGTLVHFDASDLADLLGVSRIKLDARAEMPQVLDLRGEPRCDRSWKRDGTVREYEFEGERVMLTERDAQAVGL